MNSAQHWDSCDKTIKTFVNGFIALLIQHADTHLKGVYLHGSLAMGCFYAPKSDIDILAVARDNLPWQEAARLNRLIAQYAQTRPIAGNLEFSLISARVAKAVPARPTYLLHYSSLWHDRILRGDVTYADNMVDTDLSAHMAVVRQRGICLYGDAIESTFGIVRRCDFLSSIADDLAWILEGDNICESPYYSILNICRVLHALSQTNVVCLSKDEGARWGLAHLPPAYHALIQKALCVYHSPYFPKSEADHKTGGTAWDKAALLQFKDYAKSEFEKIIQ